MAHATRAKGSCSTLECDRPHCAKGYCKLHYYRLRRTGSLVATQMQRAGRICTIAGCDRSVRARALCTLHYDRRSRGGDVGPPGSMRRPRVAGDTRISRDGYVLVYRPDYPGIKRPHYVQQHRLVMESALGRRLHPFENVHHKNGRRADNDPSNLELWVKPQPPGQRPEDLVAWVVQHYPDLVEQTLQTRKEAS